MATNSDNIVIKTLKDCFDLDADEVSRDQSLQLQKFFKSSNSTVLIAERDNNSLNGVVLKTVDISEYNGNKLPEADKAFVFVKYTKSGDSLTGEATIEESGLVSRLRGTLQSCDGSSSSVMQALSELHKAEKNQQLLEAFTAERTELLPKVVTCAENWCEIEELENIEMIDRISSYKAREAKLKAVIRVCDSIFKDLPNYYESKSTLEHIYKDLSDEALRLFREWCNSFDDVKLDSRRQCIEIDGKSQIPKLTFDPRLVKLSEDARILRCIGFALPLDIVSLEDAVRKYGVYARELREIVNFYCTVADQILLSQRPMLIDAAKRFTALLESRNRICWDSDTSKLSSWLDELKNFSKKFSSENRLLRKHHSKVLELIKPLFNLPIAKWRTNINEIKTIMQEIDLRYQNTLPWKKHWDYQLYKILEYYFNATLIKSNDLLSFDLTKNTSNNYQSRLVKSNNAEISESFKINLSFVSGVVTFKPPLEEIKAKIYLRIKKFLLMPKQFQGFLSSPQLVNSDKNSNTEPIFYAIYLRNFNNFSILYEKANEMIDELLRVRQKFVDWCSLYFLIKWQNTDTSEKSLAEFLGCHTLDDYKNNLILLKTKSQQFNKEFIDNEIICENSNFVINLVPIKTFIDWLLIEIDKLLAKSLKEKCVNQIKLLNDKCSDLLLTSSKRPENINELLLIDHLFKNQLKDMINELSAQYTELEANLSFLMKWSANIAPDISEVKSRYDEFERLCETKDSLLDTYREILRSRTDSELGNTNEEIEIFINRWVNMRTDMKESKEIISELRIECDILSVKCSELSASCDYFAIQKPKSFEQFMSIVDEVRETDAKWNIIFQFEAGFAQFLDMEWIVSRNKLNTIESYITKWEEENTNIGTMLENKVKEWRELLSILKLCRGECFSKSHWQQFLSLIGIAIDYEKLKLSHLIDAKKQLIISREAIKELNIKAANEMSINEAFNELDSFAANTILTLYTYQTSQGNEVKLIKDWRLVLSQVSESILTLQSMKSSENFTSDFVEKSLLWETRLNQLDSILSLLNSVQRKWIALEPIYSKDDTQMFNDYSFSPASIDYLEILKLISADPHVIRLIHITGLETRLKLIDQTLVSCQKKLQTFMEQSRARFPRFYFLADDDLLLILAGKVEVNQTSLLKKLFNNSIIKFNIEGNLIKSVESAEGEVITLRQSVAIDRNRGAIGVETWLALFETQLKSSLKSMLFESVSESNQSAKPLTWQLPSQLQSVGQWILFTQKTEESVRSHNLESLKSYYSKQLSSLTSQEINIDNNIENIKVKSIILDTIHFLTVIEELIEKDTRDIEDWIWQKQLRFYTNKNSKNESELQIKMGNAVFLYSFEYLGCVGGAKLVHTPLTDKCFLTLTQAMDMGLGGNPYGPAGTGKTESVKALGQHFGRLVLVFNCDEAIDVRAMTRILVGLIKCGAWGCFDEFNRLQLDVLSALSSQIQAIQLALKLNSKTVLLPEYGEVNINSNTAIFITLNPAGKQYGGRNRLPDNLKSLFLPIAMSVPDNAIISRVLLLAGGFSLNMSQELGEKITTWFELASDCMTNQKHYDWGLRAIKTCLESSGRLLKMNVNKDEIKIFVHSLYKQVKSKLIDEDDHKFNALVCDVFGGNAVPDDNQTNTDLQAAVIKVLQQKQLIVVEEQVHKIMELEEQLKSRLGVVILGQSGSGKSTLWKVLKNARKHCFNRQTTVVIINPKAITRTQLLGYIDDETREWHDGVITYKSREIARDESDTHFWFVFDGDIDPDWIEALNSVLDDNQVLTLPSGERIDFDSKRCNLVFETTSLTHASPATISRLGVVSINGNKSSELIQSEFIQKNVQISNEEVLRFVSSFGEALCVSVARTVLSHINYSINNDEDAIKGFFRAQRTIDSDVNNKIGSLIITPSNSKLIEFVRPWVVSEEHVLFVGEKGVGKHIIACETILKSGIVVRVNCTPETNPSQVIALLKSSCVFVTSGLSKVMKSSTNTKLILFIRHLEMLKLDKWRSKSLIAFLIQLICYNGFYDEMTFEWIQLQNFQIVCTCISLKYVSERLIAVMNIVNVCVPVLHEIETIILGTIHVSTSYASMLTNAFLKVVREIEQYGTSPKLDLLRIAVSIIQSLKHYTDVDRNILRYEFWRAFQCHIESHEIIDGALTSTFGSRDHSVTYVSLNGSSKLISQTSDQFISGIKKYISCWVNETEILDPNMGLISETISLFAEANNFLAEDEDNLIKCLVLVGNSGCGRKVAIRAISHAFGFDIIWSPRVAYNERQISAEMRALFYGQEDEQFNKKILLIIDEMHMKLMPHLRDKIYAISHEPGIKSMVRIVLTLNTLDSVNALMWGRVNACHIHLCTKWSIDSQTQLPPLIIPDLNKRDQISRQFHTIYAAIFGEFSALENRRFISFIHTYANIITEKSSEIEKRRKHLEIGVSKLDEVSHEVEKLKADAVEQKELLANKRSEADDALNLITSSMHASEDQKVELQQIKSKTENETMKLKVRKREIDAELKEIEPILSAAKAAVGGIKSESLAEIRSLRAPPEVIRDILEGVLRLMGVNDTSWVSMKSFLSRRGVKDEIMNFESRKITPNMREKVEILLQKRGESYEPSVAKRASVAAAPLAEWVKANIAYSAVLHKIKPLEEELNRLESGLKSAQSRMKSLSNQLEGVEVEVGSLRDRLNQVTVEAAQIEIRLNQTEHVLSQSENLIADLSGEFSRWREQLSEINTSLQLLPSKSLITAAYLVFCSGEPSTEKKRQMLEKCCHAVNIDLFDIRKFLNSESAEDIFFSVKTSHLTPLICDPAKRVIAKFKNCEITDMRSRDWIKVLELCLRFGRTLIINDFTKIDFNLLQLLHHEIYGTNGSRNWIYIGDKRVDYNNNFKIYFVTQDIHSDNLSNPLFNVINLSPSGSNMSSSLLSLAIQCRKPELEKRKMELENNKHQLEEELLKLEDNLLKKLTESSNNILSDTDLVNSLKEIKTSAKKVEHSLEESAKLSDELNKERAEYESLSTFASHIYFLVRELTNLNKMYHIGVAEYESVFIDVLNKSKELNTSQLLQKLYEYVSRGLFPEDKAIFKHFLTQKYPKESKLVQIVEEDHSIVEFVKSVHESSKIALIITSPGSDPSSELQEIASEMSAKKFSIVSMGSDVFASAEQSLQTYDDSEEWICLTNIHLVIDWLPKLTHILTDIRLGKKFIILVSECDEQFPVSLLEMSVKFAYKSVPGLQQQLKRLSVDSSVKSTPELRILSYIHAICCERLHFVPQGWTKCYEFGFNDFRYATNVIQTVMQTRHRRLRFDFIRGLLGAVIYGGKIDNRVDDNILQALIKRWFTTSNDTQNTQNEISLLGLSANVDILRQVFVQQRLIKGLRVLQNAINTNQIGEELKRLRLLWKELTANKLMNDMTASKPLGSLPLPLQAYIWLEYNHTKRMIQQIHSDLSVDDSDACQQLMSNQVPDTWLTHWTNGPQMADQFLRCVVAIANEIFKSLQSSLQSLQFNLSHIFNPKSLLSTLKQEASRQLKVTVDCLKLYCSWGGQTLRSVSSVASMRASINGIMIEGAVFDGRLLQDCQQDSPLQSQMPSLSLYFLPKDCPQPYSDSDVVSLPLYSTSSRDSFILWLDVPCDRQSQSHWIQCNASLVIKYIT